MAETIFILLVQEKQEICYFKLFLDWFNYLSLFN